MTTQKIRVFALSVGAALAMGISMPSCPGQQAMQQQIDGLTADNQNFKRQVREMETKLQAVTNLSNEFGQAKQLLSQMTDTIKEQQNAIAQMDATVKALAAKVEAAAARSAAPKGYPVRSTKPVAPKRPTVKRNY